MKGSRKKQSIFDKVSLRPAQLRTVADRRFDDAAALRDTGSNARANGAIYLGGFVIECLLKAGLLDEYAWLQNAGHPKNRSPDEQEIWHLCYRSHDLEEILNRLPKMMRRVSSMEQRDATTLTRSLKSICANWTIFARYSPKTADIDDARQFLDQIKELMPWLR